MKLKNLDIWMTQEAFNQLLAQRLPVAIGYNLATMVLKLREKHQVIDQVKNDLVKKYGTVNENGQVTVEQNSENWDKFAAEFNELMDIEVEIDITQVKIPKETDLDIETSVLLALYKFVYVG